MVPRPNDTAWRHAMDRSDAVITSPGIIAGSRWTEDRKRQSGERMGPQALVSAITGRHAARHFISSSAIGIYGTHGDEVITEESPAARTLVRRVQTVETLASKLVAIGSVLRSGLVLAPTVALPQLALRFDCSRAGALARGSSTCPGSPWKIGWVWCLDPGDDPVCPAQRHGTGAGHQSEFARVLGRVLGDRRSCPRRPSRTALLGELADALILGGQRVMPARARPGVRVQVPDPRTCSGRSTGGPEVALSLDDRWCSAAEIAAEDRR